MNDFEAESAPARPSGSGRGRTTALPLVVCTAFLIALGSAAFALLPEDADRRVEPLDVLAARAEALVPRLPPSFSATVERYRSDAAAEAGRSDVDASALVETRRQLTGVLERAEGLADAIASNGGIAAWEERLRRKARSPEDAPLVDKMFALLRGAARPDELGAAIGMLARSEALLGTEVTLEVGFDGSLGNVGAAADSLVLDAKAGGESVRLPVGLDDGTLAEVSVLTATAAPEVVDAFAGPVTDRIVATKPAGRLTFDWRIPIGDVAAYVADPQGRRDYRRARPMGAGSWLPDPRTRDERTLDAANTAEAAERARMRSAPVPPSEAARDEAVAMGRYEITGTYATSSFGPRD